MNKKLLISASLLVSALFFGTYFSSAYTTVDGVTNDRNTTPIREIISSTACLDLKSNNLGYGSSDRTTNGEVSRLQSFLLSSSLLKTQTLGNFGPSTLASVRQYQRANGISSSGYVGTLTKQKIKEQTCNVSNDAQEINPLNTFTPPKGSSTPPRTFGAICSYPAPPYGCSYIQGENFDPQTQCGLKLDCSGGGVRDMDKPTLPKPIVCTMEARICPDGSMMSRNSQTCEWLGCSVATSTPTKPFGCSREIKYCPSGEVMQRGGDCQWRPSECQENPIICKSPMRYCPDGSPMKQGANCEWKENECKKVPPFACLDVMRYCPDGSAMPRGNGCDWRPGDCPAVAIDAKYDTFGKPIIKQTETNFGATSVPKPASSMYSSRVVSQNTSQQETLFIEADRLEQLMKKSHITASQRILLTNQKNELLNRIVSESAVSQPTSPKGVVCTMQVLFCPDGSTVMPRDSNCNWYPGSCPAGGSTGGLLLPQTY